MGSVAVTVSAHVPLGPFSLAVFVLTAALAGFATLRRPALGIALLIVCDPFDWPHDLGPTQVTLPKAVLLGIFAGLALRRTSLAMFRDRRLTPLFGGALAIFACTALSVVPALYLDAALREVLKALEYLGVFVAAALAVEGDDEPVLFRTLGIASTFVCALALAQYVTGAPSATIIAGRTIPRIAGPLEGPNQLAGYLDLVVPLLLARALAGPKPWLWAALTLFATVADLLTLSRSGLFALVVGAGIVVAMRAARGMRVRRRAALAAAALVAGFAALASQLGFAARFLSVDDVHRENGLGTRAELWSAALALWKRDPGLGIGAGNFELRLPETGLYGVRTHANSLYLQTLAEGGVALFAATLWTLVAAIALCVRGAPRSAFLLGFGAAACAFAYHQIFDYLTFFPKVGLLWWALLGSAAGRLHALGGLAASAEDAA